jgi:hypothetical protein
MPAGRLGCRDHGLIKMKRSASLLSGGGRKTLIKVENVSREPISVTDLNPDRTV